MLLLRSETTDYSPVFLTLIWLVAVDDAVREEEKRRRRRPTFFTLMGFLDSHSGGTKGCAEGKGWLWKRNIFQTHYFFPFTTDNCTFVESISQKNLLRCVVCTTVLRENFYLTKEIKLSFIKFNACAVGCCSWISYVLNGHTYGRQH